MFLFIQKNLNFIILLLIFVAVSFYFYYRLEDIHNDILELKCNKVIEEKEKLEIIKQPEIETKKNEYNEYDDMILHIPYDQFLSEIEENQSDNSNL
jgi:hypothetical protein